MSKAQALSRLVMAAGMGIVVVLLCAALAQAGEGGTTRAPVLSRLAEDNAPTDTSLRPADLSAVAVLTPVAYLPMVWSVDPCAPIPGESYGVLSIVGPPTDRPAAEHADLNLALRGYAPTSAYLGLVDYGGGTDPGAPQLEGLCSGCTPPFSRAYRVNHWDWGTNSRGGPITDPPVTLIGIDLAPGTTVHVPDSGYTIGSGYEVLVLYASQERITLKYTREDNVVWGYTLHVEGICVEPNLLALYEAMNAAGRTNLPALRSGQAFGRARGEIGVAIRDTGAFMDPRSRKDWWKNW